MGELDERDSNNGRRASEATLGVVTTIAESLGVGIEKVFEPEKWTDL